MVLTSIVLVPVTSPGASPVTTDPLVRVLLAWSIRAINLTYRPLFSWLPRPDRETTNSL
jgi:hypothetical protein